MLEKLKNHPEMRRALGIAAGIFAGLLAYRVTLWAISGFASWWLHVGYMVDYGGSFDWRILVVAAVLAALATAVFRRLQLRRRAQRLGISRELSS